MTCARVAGSVVRRVRERLLATDDRGAATTEMVLITPVFLTLLFLLIQASLYFHVRNLAGIAADEAAAASSVRGATPQHGIAAANQYLDTSPSGLWQGQVEVVVAEAPGGDAIQAEVAGTVQNVMPFADLVPVLDLSVNESSERPIEVFEADL